MSSAAELDSAASTLEQLVRRVEQAADDLIGTQNEDLSVGLIEVERSLRTAGRRLERLVKELRSRS